MKVLKKPATKLTGEIRKSITSKLMFSYTRWQRKLKKTSLLEYVEFFCREKLFICSIILKRQFWLTWNVARGSKESLYPSKDGSSSSGRSLASTRSSVLAVLTIFLKLSSWSNGDRNDEDGDDLFWERLRDYQAETFRRAEGRERFSRYFIYLTLGVVRIGHKFLLSKNDIIS